MSVITSMRRQKAIWWRRTTADEFDHFIYADPIEVTCRWEDVAGQYLNAKGEVAVSQSVVYVDRAMKEGDVLKRGPMESHISSNPRDEEDTFEIKSFEELPDFSARETLYTARL